MPDVGDIPLAHHHLPPVILHLHLVEPGPEPGTALTGRDYRRLPGEESLGGAEVGLQLLHRVERDWLSLCQGVVQHQSRAHYIRLYGTGSINYQL